MKNIIIFNNIQEQRNAQVLNIVIVAMCPCSVHFRGFVPVRNPRELSRLF